MKGLEERSADWQGNKIFFAVYFIEVQLIYNVVLNSDVQQSDSAIHIFSFHILFHDGLSQDIEHSFLHSTIGPWCLSILNIIACICEM